MPADDTMPTMFLCRVLLGEPVVVLQPRKTARRAPCVHDCATDACTHTNRGDSLVAETQKNRPGAWLGRFREFVVYERQCSYPEWKIVYERVKN